MIGVLCYVYAVVSKRQVCSITLGRSIIALLVTLATPTDNFSGAAQCAGTHALFTNRS